MSMPKAKQSSVIGIIKPASDEKAYRWLVLPNGLNVMLISEAIYTKTLPGQDDADYDNMNVIEYKGADYEDSVAEAALCVGVGSFSDPPQAPGLAHFLEHMVFMGSKKYPKENTFDNFLSNARGESNAWTDNERTCFYYHVQQKDFAKSLDIFAQMFIAPLMRAGAVERELLAVESEFQANHKTDDESRVYHVLCHELCRPGHPMKRFLAGNKMSLKNAFKYLPQHFQDMYSASYMTLVLRSVDPLAAMEALAVKFFSKVADNEKPPPLFVTPPFDTASFNKEIRVVPLADIHKLELCWTLPCLQQHYRYRVVELFAALFGHEGRGSVISLLRRRNLALQLLAGSENQNSTWTPFSLCLSLTQHGFNNYTKVIEVVYEYIALIKKEIPEYFFYELKQIESTNFSRKFMDNFPEAQELAENMQLFPPEHFLCGRTLYFEYDESLVRACLDCLTPCAMLAVLSDWSFNKLSGLRTEPWTGAKYTVADHDQAFMDRLCNTGSNPELRLPEPNLFIATDFGTVKGARATAHPVVVYDKKGCRLWYKKDIQWKSPNVHIYIWFRSQAPLKSTTNMILKDVLKSLLSSALTEALYGATLAGYDHYVEATDDGLYFYVGGYSEKAKLLVETFVATVAEIVSKRVQPDSFHALTEDLRESYYNELCRPNELARNLRRAILYQEDTTTVLKYEGLDDVSYSLMTPFLHDFFKTLTVEGFVLGNLDVSTAVKIARKIGSLIKAKQNEEPFFTTVLQLPTGRSRVCVAALAGDENSHVALVCQLGAASIRTECLSEVVKSAMSEPFFNKLRTELQLGYSLGVTDTVLHGVQLFLLYVDNQADRNSVEDVEGHITTFLETFTAVGLKKIGKSDIEEIINDTRAKYEFFDDHNTMWDEIINQSYVFDRNKQKMEMLKTITYKDVEQWCQEIAAARRLTVMVEGQARPAAGGGGHARPGGLKA